MPLEPIAYVDTLPSLQPKVREPKEITRLLKVSVGGQIGYGFSLRRWLGEQHEATNVTRFDDVVNSTWFEHRIDLRGMTPEDVARGPTTIAPDTSRTLTVIGGKAAGISPGFTVRDANGTTFLFKFDPKGNLHLASAADVISSRLFYAAGYYVPEDYIVVLDPSQLVVDPEAEITVDFVERKMTRDDIHRILSLTDSLPDGRYLALASKFVPGRPLGPFYFSGARGDDANDYYYHEHRRELRGLYVMSSWLNHVDMRFANTLDVWIDPPGYVRHYLIDFAATLGSGTIRPHDPREGSEYNFDFWPSMARVLTLGFYKHGWEDQEFEVLHPSIGWIPNETFEPGKWRANWPNGAFNRATAADGYWGAKLVGAFSDEQIRAAMREGQLPVQEANEILAEILMSRRDKIIAYWYAKVTPIERPDTRFPNSEVSELEVAFDDLGIAAGVWTAGQTRYSWKFKDVYQGIEAAGEHTADPGERQSLRIALEGLDKGLPGVDDPEATATLRVEVRRDGKPVKREAVIYLRWDGSDSSYRVVGLQH
ncbi:MAG: hypothetical protein V3U13_03745 [Gemmatimonadota bacterium]